VLAVSGASGHLGRGVAERLLAGGAGPVRLLTRTPDALADLAARGAEVRRVDLDDPATLRGALDGVSRLLLVSTDALDRRVEQHRAAIDEAVRAGVGHVVYTSVVNPEPSSNPAAVVETHRRTEDDLRAAGCAWTMLRNGLYAEFQAQEATEAAAGGKLVHNRGDGRAAYVSREDCAASAAAVLTGDGHEGRAYDITGPESLSAADLAGIYTELTGRAIAVESIDDNTFVAMLSGESGDGHLAYGARLVASFGRAIREGCFEGVSDAVQTLTGRPPRSVREVLRDALG